MLIYVLSSINAKEKGRRDVDETGTYIINPYIIHMKKHISMVYNSQTPG